MSVQTLTIPATVLRLLRAGDRIVAVDGEDLGEPLTVELPLGAGTGRGVKLVHESPDGVEWYLYPADVEAVTIERGKAAPEKVRRQLAYVTIRKYGIPLRRYPDGSYATEDGRYRLALDTYMGSECDRPHPVRMTADKADELLRAYEELRKSGTMGEDSSEFTHESITAAREGRDGYVCPGGVRHPVKEWTIWDNQIDDHLNRDPDGYDTLTAAAKRLAAEYPTPTSERS